MKLYSAWRASAPYRVRIALNLKALPFEIIPIDLVANEQGGEAYRAHNRQALVPTLDIGAAELTQSLAILEWLEETHPEPALLPRDPIARARVRAMCGIIACDIHPLNNLRVLKTLAGLGVEETVRNDWVQRWIGEGFTALEAMIAEHGGQFAFGDTPTLADCVIVPQIYNARRFSTDLSPYPRLLAAATRAGEHPAIAAAHPNHHPDAKEII
jgi:maleylacetoacetate isomerase/maleylpyruvate isomerase